MSWLSNLFSGGASTILDSATGLVKSVYTSPGEKISQEEALQRVQNVLLAKQQEVDKVQIQANGAKKDPAWKSAIAWVCVVGISLEVIVRPLFIGIMTHTFPRVEIGTLITLISGMLGMSTLHLFDKLKSK